MMRFIHKNSACRKRQHANIPFFGCAIALLLGAAALLIGCPDAGGSGDADTTPPAEVGSPAVSGAGDTSATITWTIPTDSDFAKTQITWTPDDGLAEVPADTSPNDSYTVTGLSPGTAYTFTIKTVDTAGNMSAGEEQLHTTTNDDPPSTISDLTAVPNDGMVTLNWTNPSDSDFAKVQVTWTPDDGTAEVLVGDDPNDSYTVTGLTNGTDYTFTVTTVDSADNSMPSASPTISMIPALNILITLDLTSDSITVAAGEIIYATVDLASQHAYSIDGTIAASSAIADSDLSLSGAIDGAVLGNRISACPTTSAPDHCPSGRWLIVPESSGVHRFALTNTHSTEMGALTLTPRYFNFAGHVSGESARLNPTTTKIPFDTLKSNTDTYDYYIAYLEAGTYTMTVVDGFTVEDAMNGGDTGVIVILFPPQISLASRTIDLTMDSDILQFYSLNTLLPTSSFTVMNPQMVLFMFTGTIVTDPWNTSRTVGPTFTFAYIE